MYSFGVLLLEIVTGKHPTDVLFHERSSLHEWVKSHYPHKLEPVVKAMLERCAPQTTQVYDKRIWCDVVLELIELGLICTQYNPSTRPTMSDIAQEMARLKHCLSSPSTTLLIEEEARAKPIFGHNGSIRSQIL